jgi:tRNA pseudouridine38-40 synthase
MNQPVDLNVSGLISLSPDAETCSDSELCIDPNQLVRLRLDFAYEGTDFAGWAKQPDQRTVQGEILRALSNIFEQDPDEFTLVVAGRTDAGVHANGQVAHLDLTQQQFQGPGRNLKQRLNSLMDEDVRIYTVSLAPAGFDARFAAIHRRYIYRIADANSVQSPISARNTLFIWKDLNLVAMQDTVKELIGLHDFASFCKPRPGSSTIRDLKSISIKRRYSRDNVIEIELMADAFCHNMVRSIVGALIAVGDGRATKDDIAKLFARADRVGSYKVVDPKGLTLVEIGYPAADLMEQQVLNTKAVRSADEIDKSE